MYQNKMILNCMQIIKKKAHLHCHWSCKDKKVFLLFRCRPNCAMCMDIFNDQKKKKCAQCFQHMLSCLLFTTLHPGQKLMSPFYYAFLEDPSGLCIDKTSIAC